LSEFILGCQILGDVFSAIFSTAGWVILGLLALLVVLFRRQIAATWSRLTEWVIAVFTWIHLSESLPKDYEAPWPFRGYGGGREDQEMAEGEQLELVLIAPRSSIWLARQPAANPNRKDSEGKPAKGSPPLIAFVFILPLLLVAVVWFSWSLLWFFNDGVPVFPPASFLVLVAIGGLLLFVPVYWVCEFNRRNQKLVVTTLVAYRYVCKFGTRVMHRSPNPLVWIQEAEVSSAFSESPNALARAFGGWWNKLDGTGDLDFGTVFETAGEMLRRFVRVSILGEILKALNSEAKARKFSKELALKLSGSVVYNGSAEEAIAPVGMAGGRSAFGEALQKSEAILEQFRRDHPGGGVLNCADPRMIGYTLWDLETGDPLPEREAATA